MISKARNWPAPVGPFAKLSPFSPGHGLTVRNQSCALGATDDPAIQHVEGMHHTRTRQSVPLLGISLPLCRVTGSINTCQPD